MNYLALGIFVFCFWAVFSPTFRDGIVAKQLLALSAITAALVFLDPHNLFAAITSITALGFALTYWYFKSRHVIFHYQQRHKRRY